MNNCLRGRGSQEFPDAANTMNLIIGRLADRVDVGGERKGVIKKYAQVPCSHGTRDMIITYMYGRSGGFLAKSRVNEQKLCLAVIEF